MTGTTAWPTAKSPFCNYSRSPEDQTFAEAGDSAEGDVSLTRTRKAAISYGGSILEQAEAWV